VFEKQAYFHSAYLQPTFSDFNEVIPITLHGRIIINKNIKYKVLHDQIKPNLKYIKIKQ
jgi:hypothetical protein